MFRAFFLLIFGLVAGVIGYQAGVAATATGAAGTVVVLGGGPGLGTFLFLLFIGFIVFGGAKRRMWAHGHGGPDGQRGFGHFGPMGWGGGRGSTDPNDPRREWLTKMHRSLHEAESASGSTGSTPTGSTPTGSTPTGTTGTPGSTPPASA